MFVYIFIFFMWKLVCNTGYNSYLYIHTVWGVLCICVLAPVKWGEKIVWGVIVIYLPCNIDGEIYIFFSLMHPLLNTSYLSIWYNVYCVCMVYVCLVPNRIFFFSVRRFHEMNNASKYKITSDKIMTIHAQ